jgi:threonyl-tRNA synthetase
MFIKVHRKIMSEMEKLNRNYELLINYSSPEIYTKFGYLAYEISKDIRKPVLIYLYPPEEGRYWILNIEYHIIDVLGRPREIGTTQIDIKNGERFGIKYITQNNQEKYVIILHNALIGTIERYIYTLFDTALRKEKPTLPLWVSPVQVRILTVSDKYNEFAREIARKLESAGIRVELDDRDLTLGKKIMDAEKLWVSYIVIIGEKEVNANKLSVRVRGEGNKEMTVEDLINEILEKTKEYPKLESYWPLELSRRPSNF